MPKRQAEDAEIHQEPRAKGEPREEGMGEFEDQWEDEMSDEEIIEGDLEADGRSPPLLTVSP
jgi:hypothetical protein